jgi:hypothetical protein
MEEFRIDPTIAYDVVELPSRGIHYPGKKKSVRVAYLTAADENILTSSNLIATGGIIMELLRRKVLDKDIQAEDIIEEDRQAILIFLRNTSFGTEYHIKNLTDPKTNEKFDAVVDLSILKLKDFNLVEDSNGEYQYFLKKSGINVTFKFLTQKQEEELDTMKNSWKGEGVAPTVTKRLEMHIKSINGNKNPMEIYSFINNKMPITDSQEFRKFIDDNKPGLNLTQTIETPSKETIQVAIGFGAEFFRPFFGI